MKFDDKHRFDKPVSAVIKMFTDRAYFERKYQALGASDLEVLEHECDSRRFRIKCRFTMKSDAPIPGAVRRFIGDNSVVTQQDAWDIEKCTGRIDAEIKGLPAKVSADMALKDEGGGSANHLKWTVSCGVPLLGGKLEQVIAEDIKIKSGRDLAQSRKLLKGYR